MNVSKWYQTFGNLHVSVSSPELGQSAFHRRLFGLKVNTGVSVCPDASGTAATCFLSADLLSWHPPPADRPLEIHDACARAAAAEASKISFSLSFHVVAKPFDSVEISSVCLGKRVEKSSFGK